MSARALKLYGERNTSTRYLSALIQLNLDAHELPGVVPKSVYRLQKKISPNSERIADTYFAMTFPKNLGWKHASVKPYQGLRRYRIVRSGTAFITVTKNPYSWLLSLHRRPYLQKFDDTKPPFGEFLRRPMTIVGRDNLDGGEINPIQMWNLKNRSYLGLGDEQCLRTTAEEVLRDPEEVIQNVSDKFSISRTSATFINHDESTKRTSKTSDDYRSYYLGEKWRKRLSASDIAVINNYVDRDLMSHFGYEVLD